MELVQNLQVYSLTYSSLNTEHWFCDESRFVFERIKTSKLRKEVN